MYFYYIYFPLANYIFVHFSVSTFILISSPLFEPIFCSWSAEKGAIWDKCALYLVQIYHHNLKNNFKTALSNGTIFGKNLISSISIKIAPYSMLNLHYFGTNVNHYILVGYLKICVIEVYFLKYYFQRYLIYKWSYIRQIIFNQLNIMVSYVVIIGLCNSVASLWEIYVMLPKFHVRWMRFHFKRMQITGLEQ